jgi:integrase
MAKLTFGLLSNAKPGATITDPAVTGLRYRVRPGGIFGEYRFKLGTPRKLRAVPLGRVDLDACKGVSWVNGKPMPPHSMLHLFDNYLEQFRAKARELRRKVSQGVDPRASAAGDTLGLVGEMFLRHVVKRPKTQIERERHLRRDWAPLHHRPLAELSRREIAAHVLTLKDHHGAPTANRARSTLCALYNWAIAQGLCEANPVEKAGKADEPPPPERTLSLAELRAIWNATEGEGDYNAIVRLLALLGQRREEVGGMRWPELSPDLTLWSLPGSRTKNKRPHQVPLPHQAVALLAARPRLRAHVFGTGAGGFTGWTHAKRRLDARCGVAGWRLHHLRHAFVTHCAELGLGMPHVIESAVNHQSGHKGGIAGRYNKALYAEEKARLMQRWAEYLLGSGEAEGEAQVIALDAARRAGQAAGEGAGS